MTNIHGIRVIVVSPGSSFNGHLGLVVDQADWPDSLQIRDDLPWVLLDCLSFPIRFRWKELQCVSGAIVPADPPYLDEPLQVRELRGGVQVPLPLPRRRPRVGRGLSHLLQVLRLRRRG